MSRYDAGDVTVVVPALNRADLIERAVRSALDQTTPPREVIVVDDCSEDDTADIAERAGARVLRLPTRSGSGPARNAGVEAARTALVSFLDSDDQWLPHHLATVVPELQPEHCLVASCAVDSMGRVRGGTGVAAALIRPSAMLFPENPVVTSTVVIEREQVLRVGGFRAMPRAQDLDLWLRLAESRPALVLPDVTAIYFVHDAQVTADLRQTRNMRAVLIESYAGAAWWTRRLADDVGVISVWDDLRQAQRGRDLAAVLRNLWWLLGQPSRWAALRRVLRYRRVQRQRSAVLTHSGAGS